MQLPISIVFHFRNTLGLLQNTENDPKYCVLSTQYLGSFSLDYNHYTDLQIAFAASERCLGTMILTQRTRLLHENLSHFVYSSLN